MLKRMKLGIGLCAGLAALTAAGLGAGWFLARAGSGEPVKLDEFRGVAVFDNGPLIARSHGRHYAEDGYYFGQKWQCVEFVKRYFYLAHQHRMPDVWGHAKDFFAPDIAHGQVNSQRGLLQFRNGGDVPPRPGDLVVFTNGFYGHVAIITAVRADEVEVIQQNIFGRPRDAHLLVSANGRHLMGESYRPAGWLRVPAAASGRQLSP